MVNNLNHVLVKESSISSAAHMKCSTWCKRKTNDLLNIFAERCMNYEVHEKANIVQTCLLRNS